MARPVQDSKARRIVTQAIMWAILGLTVGLAALVNARQRSALNADLGEPRQFEGFSLRLPRTWTVPDDPEEPRVLIEVREPYFDTAARRIDVSLEKSPTTQPIAKMMEEAAAQRTTRSIETISVGGADGALIVRREPVMFWPGASYFTTKVSVTRIMPDERVLNITLTSAPGRPGKKEINRDVDLMKRIAASVSLSL
jgi:hypothetical protein